LHSFGLLTMSMCIWRSIFEAKRSYLRSRGKRRIMSWLFFFAAGSRHIEALVQASNNSEIKLHGCADFDVACAWNRRKYLLGSCELRSLYRAIFLSPSVRHWKFTKAWAKVDVLLERSSLQNHSMSQLNVYYTLSVQFRRHFVEEKVIF